MHRSTPKNLPLTFSIVTESISDGLYRLSTSQKVSATPEQVFPFFEDPSNLFRITPDWLDFRLLNGDGAAKPGKGSRYNYTIRWFGMKIHWQSEIEEHEPPRRFVDIQLRGPYVLWNHLHSFEAVNGGTLLRDEVTYCLPFGPLGRLAHWLVVKRQLHAIFLYRASRINEWIIDTFNPKKGL